MQLDHTQDLRTILRRKTPLCLHLEVTNGLQLACMGQVYDAVNDLEVKEEVGTIEIDVMELLARRGVPPLMKFTPQCFLTI